MGVAKSVSLRARLVAHLSDARRQKCLVWLCANAPPLPEAEQQRLDVLDRSLRAAARRAGFTQPRSTAPAEQAGRKIGRVQP